MNRLRLQSDTFSSFLTYCPVIRSIFPVVVYSNMAFPRTFSSIKHGILAYRMISSSLCNNSVKKYSDHAIQTKRIFYSKHVRHFSISSNNKYRRSSCAISLRNFSSSISYRLRCIDKIFPLGISYRYSSSSSSSSSGASFTSRNKRGDPSTIPHLREYARVPLKCQIDPLDEDGILFDEDYHDLVFNYGSATNQAIFSPIEETARIVVLQPWIKWGSVKRNDTTKELLLEEACALVHSLDGGEVVYEDVISVTRLSKHKIFGEGKLYEVAEKLNEYRPLQAVFISHEMLTRSYKRELEELFKVRVLDRYSLVLAIFQQHALTLEAKLQVALAEIPYVRSHISDEKHRVIVNKREQKLKDALDDLSDRRKVVRRERKKLALPSVAIIGYTNAGKTSLIRALTGDDKVIGKDYLFATLDVTSHRCLLPCGLPILLLDTVGFIQDIPTNLIASFIATLDDAVYADVVIHVRDSSHPDRICQSSIVLDTLERLPLPPTTPVITIDSKSDIPPLDSFGQEHTCDGQVIEVSSMTGKGLDTLLNAMEVNLMKIMGKQPITMKLHTGSNEVNWLRKKVGITRQEVDSNDYQCVIVTSAMSQRDIAAFQKFVLSQHDE